MLGAILGDVIGAQYLSGNVRKKDVPLFSHKCHFTGNTVMICAIAKAYLECNGNYNDLEKYTHKHTRKFGEEYIELFTEKDFYDWIISENFPPYYFDNIAAARIAPIPYITDSPIEIKDNTQLVTEVSHLSKEAINGAEAVAIAINLAKSGHSISYIRNHINKYYYKLNFTLSSIRATYGYTTSCNGTVPQAIVAFLESTSFEDAIRNAVSLGGDCDTIAAITGSIAEAYYGVPREMQEEMMHYIPEPLMEILVDIQENLINAT